jgi:CheY-like chemotaxis protein
VAGIVRSQKGGITLESQPGRGSVFRVFLPASAGWVEQSGGGQTGGEHKTILVVDDEAAVRNFLAAVLRKRGYRIVTAADGREALALFERESDAIAAVVLDVIMPVMGGNDALPKLKALRPDLKILLTSGYSESEARRLCAAYPGAAFIQKPYTAQQLGKAVEDLVG